MKTETMNRSYRYRLYPTRGQARALEGQLDFACDLYNAALEQRRTAFRYHGKSVRLGEQGRELTEARRDGPKMNYACQEMVLQRLDLAFQAFFRRVSRGEAPGFPRFKPRQRYNTLTWRAGQGGAVLVHGRLRVQGVGDVKVKWHRDLPSAPKQTRITGKNGRWYVSFSVEVERGPLSATGQEIGIDLGIRQFATLSSGEVIKSPRPAWQGAAAIRRSQRKVQRRERGSSRRRKAVAELARSKEREANRRLDAAHKAAHSLVQRFDLIAVEDLKPPNMVKGGRWLAREISDQGWSQFLKCLEDKAESAGRRVVRVDPRNTSRRCHACGAVDKDSRQGPAFACTTCGHEADADHNAALNILHRARTGPSDANSHSRGSSEKSQPRSRHSTERIHRA